MADNIDVTPGTGKTIAADLVTIDGAAALVQRVKPVFGAPGSGADADLGVGTGGSATQRIAIDSSQVTTTGSAGSPSTQVLSVQGVASGTAIPVSLATAPALVAGTASIGTVQAGVTAIANGATVSRINATASNNLTSVKASAGQLYTIDVFNVAAYNVFLKLYNKASAPVVASDTPIITIPIQAGGGFSKTWPMGLPFATGIAYAIVKLQADTDATNVVAGDLTGNIVWI